MHSLATGQVGALKKNRRFREKNITARCLQKQALLAVYGR